MSNLLHDIRTSWRFWSRYPRAATTAVFLLALGIGACTTVFSVAEAVLWRSLPFPQPDCLVMFWEKPPRLAEASPASWRVASYPAFADWRRQIDGLDGLAASRPWQPILTTGQELEPVAGARVSADFFQVLGLEPALGRDFASHEGQPGAEAAVILGHHLWKSRFGADTEILGRTLSFDDSGEAVHATVIGVLPPRVRIAEPIVSGEAEIFTLLRPDESRGRRYYRVIGRLAASADLSSVQAPLESLSQAFQVNYPDTNQGWGAEVGSLGNLIADKERPAVRLLLTAAGLLFLVAVANVGILLLLLESDRRRELAMRVVLGARPYQIWRQMVIESSLLSLSGAVLGLLLTIIGLKGMQVVGLIPGTIFAIDRWVLAATAGLCLLTTTVFGVLPARRFASLDLSAIVRGPGSSCRSAVVEPGARRAWNPRRSLVLAEISLALVLVAAAALMLQSFIHMLHVDPGFEARGALTMRLRIPESLHPQKSRVEELWQRLPSAIKDLPQVETAGLINYLPMQGTSQGTRAWRADGAPAEGLRVEVRGISHNYFLGMGIPLHGGRDFSPSDVSEGRPLIIISETLADRLWPKTEAIGQRLSLAWMGPGTWEVVGVVGKVQLHEVTSAGDPAVYLPFDQAPHSAMTLVVRSESERPQALVETIRQRLAEIDKTFVVDRVNALPQVVGATLAKPRGQTVALAVFALVAVCLSAGGAYSIVAYSVARRRHDFSIRLALGAHPRDLVRGVAAQGLRDAVAGVGLGLILFVFLARQLSDLLFGVRASDPWLLTGISVLMTLVVWLAAYLPARRAAGVDPAPSLRAV